MNLFLAVLLLGSAEGPGPAVGERLPEFEALAHDGKRRSFAELTGPRGLVLLVFRSADW